MQIQSLPSAQLARTLNKAPQPADPQPPAEKPDLWHDGRPWNHYNQPATLVASDQDGRQTLSGFRWGWTEAADKKDWEPHFQNTTVDTKKLKDVHFYLEHFYPAGHAALVFEFDGPAVQGADGKTTNKLVYSIEARRKEGESWTAARGLKKTMGVVHQLMTFEDARQWVTRRQAASLETRRLDLSDEEKQRMLSTALSEAVADRTGEYYHTTRNSCYSGLQKVMCKALPEKGIMMMSPITAGLIMRPDDFMTSQYNTVLKRMHIHSRESARCYVPDAQMHPEKRAERLKRLTGQADWISGIARQSWFPSFARLTGGALGASLGVALGHNLLLGGLAGYIGYRGAGIGADLLEGNATRTIAN
ncbi:MAG: DUF4105 domain-containing protein [Candidatus Eremiobacteraeota bacterium]|nr:DUF4105 domain-containing protein [Candidatus Eremiobacteraeota bacterium]MCW5868554.1 DUF4105 domain-containing protein [Candidatus Eremiobacteraeota bacterium]